ncbi:T9SS type A sorting domain-containing protein [bacterium]|nr:T9SS type A sorting domain-containing protein [bacterium]
MLRLLACLALGLLLSGCLDLPPGEISVRTLRKGRRQGCTVQVFNEAGKQIAEQPTDNVGLLFLKNLRPGQYTLKFKDNQGKMLPAEKTVRVVSDGSEIVDVELTEKPPPPPPLTPEEQKALEDAKKKWWEKLLP